MAFWHKSFVRKSIDKLVAEAEAREEAQHEPETLIRLRQKIKTQIPMIFEEA